MNKNLFYDWLKAYKKLDTTTSGTRTSSCLRVEKYYGDLDEQYTADRCSSLIEQLTYTTSDKKFGNKAKHIIPIDGDIYNGTQSLKAAIRLFIEFKDNRFITELKVAPDINPNKHDGSYELIRNTVQSLTTVNRNELDVNDLDLLYLMAIGTWRSGVDVKKQKIKDSHLSNDEKEKLINVLNDVVEKAKKHEYDNLPEESKILGWSIGMFGTGFHTFASKSDKRSAEEFISLCVEIKDMSDDELIFEKAEQSIKRGIRGMQSAAASVVLHCLKPNVFPIINGAVSDTAVLFEIEGVTLYKPKELEYYIQNARNIRKFRNEKCLFRNYRVMDKKLAIYNRFHEIYENEENSSAISQGDEIKIWKIAFIDNYSVSLEKFDEYLNKKIIIIHEKTEGIENYNSEETIKVGDYFYLCNDEAEVKLFGIISSEELDINSRTEGWHYRKCEIIAYSKEVDFQVSVSMKEWMPNFKTTMWPIPKGDYIEFEKDILEPCFDLKLIDLNLGGNPILNEIDLYQNYEKSEEIYDKEMFLEEVFISEQQYDEIAILLNRKKNIILQGAPGVGKTFAAKRLAYSLMGCMDDNRIEMVQFHQNYSYEDFVMGYRPVESGGFELRNGIFHQFCVKASMDLTRNYYFIIDEINRGNLSKIFGELLMLIENDKRGLNYSVPLTYQPKSRFFVPQNIFIIGMMNTADRSLAMIDYALRRRFCYIEMEPAFGTHSFRKHLINNGIHEELIEKIIIRMNYLNNQIAADGNLGRGFKIGHSYFCNTSTDENWYQSIIEYEINPLIEEYWFDNEEKAQEYMDYLLG